MYRLKRLFISKAKQLAEAWRLFNSVQKEEAIGIALPLVDHKKYKYEASLICGLSNYKLLRYSEAISFFETASSLLNYRHDWYNLAMANVHCNKFSDAQNAFEKINQGVENRSYKIRTSHAEMILQFARILHIKGNDKLAIYYINELKRMYAGVRNMNPDILAQRGLPSLDIFLKFTWPIIETTEDDPRFWLSQFSNYLDKIGKSQCDRFLPSKDKTQLG